jgi:cytochrome P450
MVTWNMYRNDREVAARGRIAYNNVREHVRPIVEQQVRSPGDHLLGEIVRNYKEAGVLDFEQMIIFTVGLVTGGFETTAWMMACALGAFLLHPEVMDEVRRDRTLLPAALEESMRWTPSFVGVLRQATREVTLSGVTIPANSTVILCLASAHYDDEHFTKPEVFDIHRKADHMLFAAGPHYCLGAPLARMEARVAISRLLDAMPGLRLAPGKEHPFVLGALGSAMHGPTALHILHDAAPKLRGSFPGCHKSSPALHPSSPGISL